MTDDIGEVDESIRAVLHALEAVLPAGAVLLRTCSWARAEGAGVCLGVAGRVLVLGPANPHPAVDEAWSEVAWVLPPVLQRIARVADGLGPAGGRPGRWGPDALLPCAAMEPLTARVRFGADTIPYAPHDLLRFHADAHGGGWCLARTPMGALVGARYFDGPTQTLGLVVPVATALRALVGRWIAPEGARLGPIEERC